MEILTRQYGLSKGSIDAVIGGPPCQSFSVAATQRFLKTDCRFKRKGFSCKEKGSLPFEYLRVINAIMPKVFILENVPGILTVDGGLGISALIDAAKASGYNIHGPFIVNASDYGVPQHRKRVFLVGSLSKGKYVMPEPKYANNQGSFAKRSKNVVAQALANIPEMAFNHETRNHNKESIARYRKLQYGQREMLGRVDRLSPMEPSKTVIAGGSAGGGRSHLHPYVARTLTVRECARIQTFPDDYVFCGKIGRQFTLVGNAVPPLLAEQIARKIGETYFAMDFQGKGLTYLPKYPPIKIAYNTILKEASKYSRELCYEDMTR
jgi:DNA (cytosine-5)-methyltransferase 1